jgi:hypothetical protein
MDQPSSNNVYPLKPGAQAQDMLQVTRSLALQVLPPILAGVLARADDALFDLVQKSYSTFEQQQFFDAMRELRRQRGGIEQRYREHFIAAFVGLEKRKPVLAHYSQPGEASNELSLLNEEELEEQLAAEQVAQAVERRHTAILLQLDAQLTRVVGGVLVNSMNNPIGPGHVAASLRAGLRGCDLAASARLVLFKLYEQALLPALTPFYVELVKRMANAGLGGAPGLQKPVRPTSPAPATSQPGAEPLADGSAPAGYAGGYAGGYGSNYAPGGARGHDGQVRDDLFVALHGLLEDYRAAQRATGAAPTMEQTRPDAPPLAGDETLTVLSLMQRELPASVHAAVADPRQSLAGQIKRELIAQAERMGVGSPGAVLAAQDEDAIDLVGMLFEVLLNERKFQEQVRRLFTQMIVPFTKVAMLDRRMFMHKTHPARRMLNAVAEACDGNQGETALERELLDRVQGLVDRLVAEFNEDLAIFETLQEEFTTFLEQHRKRVELAERRAAEAQRGRERLEQARAVASMELATLMGAREAPPALDSYLRRYWSHHLALVILRDGVESERFLQARASGEKVWNVMLECEAGRPRLALLGPLIEPVLASSGVTGQSAQDVIVAIESVLDAMHVGDHAHVEAAELPGNLPPVEPEPVQVRIEVRPTPVASDNVVALRPQDEVVGTDAASNGTDASAIASEPAAASEPEAATITADAADVEKIRKLEVGNWVEMVGEDGTPQPAKLSWISPISNRLLFVNRRGMRVCAASAEELAVMLKNGKLSLREIDTAFERAMTQVLGKLRESQGQRAGA